MNDGFLNQQTQTVTSSVIDRDRAIGVRGWLASRTVEYGLMFVLAATIVYTAAYAWGTHNDVQHSLRSINSALGIV